MALPSSGRHLDSLRKRTISLLYSIVTKCCTTMSRFVDQESITCYIGIGLLHYLHFNDSQSINQLDFNLA